MNDRKIDQMLVERAQRGEQKAFENVDVKVPNAAYSD